jgi:hypothetical protein
VWGIRGLETQSGAEGMVRMAIGSEILAACIEFRAPGKPLRVEVETLKVLNRTNPEFIKEVTHVDNLHIEGYTSPSLESFQSLTTAKDLTIKDCALTSLKGLGQLTTVPWVWSNTNIGPIRSIVLMVRYTA